MEYPRLYPLQTHFIVYLIYYFILYIPSSESKARPAYPSELSRFLPFHFRDKELLKKIFGVPMMTQYEVWTVSGGGKKFFAHTNNPQVSRFTTHVFFCIDP